MATKVSSTKIPIIVGYEPTSIAMISSTNLRFSYSESKQFNFPDIHCPDQETLLILGQSGKGKTTLLHLLALLLKPTFGDVNIAGNSTKNISSSQAAQVRASDIGIVYQRPHFVSALSVLDNLMLPNYLSNAKEDKDKAIFLAEQLGFAEHLQKKTNQMSQGEQQRVSIARALMNQPNVILADEPTSSLDDKNCEKVIALLTRQSALIGASLVVVTHDQRLKDIFPNQVFL